MVNTELQISNIKNSKYEFMFEGNIYTYSITTKSFGWMIDIFVCTLVSCMLG